MKNLFIFKNIKVFIGKSNSMNSLKKVIRENLEKIISRTLVLKEDVQVSEELRYHIENELSLTDNVFRVYSQKYFDLVNEVRELWLNNLIKLNEEDTMMVLSDLGNYIIHKGEKIYLDAPFVEEYESEEDIIEEAKHRGKNVKLNKPFRTPGGPKKFAVYVRKPGGGVKKVTFGDPGLKVRNRNPKAAKSFRARHKCSQKKDRTTAGYWSCSVGRYAKQLGLSSSNSW